MPDLIHLAIPAFVILLLVEAIAGAVMRRDLYEWRDTAASLTMGIGNVVIALATKAIAFGVFTFLYAHSLFKFPFAWWTWALAFIAEDFTYYWFHRASHECRFFWASHVVHHSSQRYNLGTALRQTWTGGWVSFIFWLWMPLLGFPPAMVLTLQAVSLLYQFWIHTELVRSTGPLEQVLNTPSHHRVHHGSNVQYLDRNHGGWLIVWDKIFGTFEREDEQVVYGLTSNIGTYNPLRIAFHEWAEIWHDVRTANSWQERVMYVFGSPGWKYERESLSCKQAAQ